MPERLVGVLDGFASTANRVIDVHVGLGIVWDVREDVAEEVLVVGDPRRANHHKGAIAIIDHVIYPEGDSLTSHGCSKVAADALNLAPRDVPSMKKEIVISKPILINHNLSDKAHYCCPTK